MKSCTLAESAKYRPRTPQTRQTLAFKCALVFFIVFLVASSASAQRSARRRGAPEGATARPLNAAAFGGSEFDYRNVVSARTFDRNADLTYNPYYAMELHLAPAFRMGPYVRLTLDFLLSRELTRSDTTTKRGETILDDVFLETELRKVPKIPVLKLKVTPALRLYVPTSKQSQARTLILAIRPEITLSRRVNAFDGLVFAYAISVRKNFHESTTAMTETPMLRPVYGSSRSLESFSNLGARNVSVAVTNIFSISLAFKKRFAALLAMGISHGFLYPRTSTDSRISDTPMPDTRVRYEMRYTGELGYQPIPFMTLALGFLTENEQLAQNAAYESPFFNRYTTIFFDIRVDIEALANRSLRPKRRDKKRKK